MQQKLSPDILSARWTRRGCLCAALLLLMVIPLLPHVMTYATSTTPYDWLQFNGDAQHSGSNRLETLITPATVSHLHMLFHVTLPVTRTGYADGAPAYLHAITVTTPSGGSLHDLLYATTSDGHILALDAHSGAVIWSRQHGTTQLCPAPEWLFLPNAPKR